MRNRFALLSEAYAYATFKDRILATNYFIEEAMNFAHQNVAKIKKAVQDADLEALPGKTLATRAQIKNGPMIEILMGEVEDEKNPLNGRNMNRRKDVIVREQMVDRLWFEPTVTETVPAEYRAGHRHASARPAAGARHRAAQDHGGDQRPGAVHDYGQYTAAGQQLHRHRQPRASQPGRRMGRLDRRGANRFLRDRNEPETGAPGVLPARTAVRRRTDELELSG